MQDYSKEQLIQMIKEDSEYIDKLESLLASRTSTDSFTLCWDEEI